MSELHDAACQESPEPDNLTNATTDKYNDNLLASARSTYFRLRILQQIVHDNLEPQHDDPDHLDNDEFGEVLERFRKVLVAWIRQRTLAHT